MSLLSNTMSAPELAKRWNISLRTLYDRKDKGYLPTFYRNGVGPKARMHFKHEDVEAFEVAHNMTEGKVGG